jgi:hypothetical protein
MKGNNQKSIECYQQHFESAKNERTEKKRQLIDKARVYLGLARANSSIGNTDSINHNFFIENHLKIVLNSSTNIKPLIEWKAKKDK